MADTATTEPEVDLTSIEPPSGYGPLTYFAARYQQGGRTVYSIDLSLADIIDTLRRPDPEKRLEGNRRISPAHARSFGRYLVEKGDWTSPPLLLRIPSGEVEFDAKLPSSAGTDWGYLRIPRTARDEIAIIDGQHRVLGLHMAWDSVTDDLKTARTRLALATRNGEVPEVIRALNEKVNALRDARDRFAAERMTLQIVVEDDLVAYRQIFVDIADNAKGISRSVTGRFDSRKIVNRCIEPVAEHRLLADRVDIDGDRVGKKSPYLMSAKHVADLVRTLEVGINGRIGARLERELKEEHLISQANDFLDLIVSAFPQLSDIIDGNLDPSELRDTSLLGSVTIQRVLAGAYHSLIHGDEAHPAMTKPRIRDFFHSLDMSAPVAEDSPWMETDTFQEPYMTPVARRQEVQRLTEAIASWARQGTEQGAQA